MSETERAALEAGDVWVDGEIFSGRPDLRRLASEPWPELTAEERAFLDGPVEEVCRMVDDHALHRTRRLPDEVWAVLRRRGFFGLVIPKEHGGLGFSALAASAVFGKLATRSAGLSTVVLIPNSVGPAELLLAHGTEEQKARLLPRLARGDEIPCFALTEPEAGSDAASIASRGVVFRGDDGRAMLRLSWEKRYITLAPVATLLGLAVRLEDPEEILGPLGVGGTEPGISVVLVPTDLPGVETGRHHDPLGVPMPNGPTRGRGVVVAVEDAIPGGAAGAGRGWGMLMEALSSGRAISLPAQSVAGVKLMARGVGAYAAVRRQFGLPIGRFEGIEEPLARIAGFAYVMEAARVATCGAIDAGLRPAVISGAVKLRQTELFRELAADGMDVLGGAGICLGPRNLMAKGWIGAPIGITVEGANILTRTLIVFGQGVIRSHPHALELLRAAEAEDGPRFLRALARQAGSFLGHLVRAPWRSLTRGRFVRSPLSGPGRGEAGRWWRRLAWASSSFALLADLALLSLGGDLKRRGKLSGRFADALSWIYLAWAALRRFEAEGRRPEDAPLLHWAAGECLHRADRALHGILENFESPVAPLRWLLRGPVAWWSRLAPIARPPSDRLGSRVAAVLLTPGERRDRLTDGVFLPAAAPAGGPPEPLALLERAFDLAVEAEPLLARLRQARKAREVPAGAPETVLAEAVAAGVLDQAEAEIVRRAAELRREAIRVDELSREEYLAAAPEAVRS
jgi:acyl-CoA dehydrogenase